MLQYTAGILDLTSTREEIYFLQAFDMFQIKPLIIQIEEKFQKKMRALTREFLCYTIWANGVVNIMQLSKAIA